MVIKSIKKNPIIKDLYSKKYKPKIIKPKKGKGSFKRIKKINFRFSKVFINYSLPIHKLKLITILSSLDSLGKT